MANFLPGRVNLSDLTDVISQNQSIIQLTYLKELLFEPLDSVQNGKQLFYVWRKSLGKVLDGCVLNPIANPGHNCCA